MDCNGTHTVGCFTSGCCNNVFIFKAILNGPCQIALPVMPSPLTIIKGTLCCCQC